MPRKDPTKKSLRSINQSVHLTLSNRLGISRAAAGALRTQYLRQLKTGDWKTPLGVDSKGKPITIRRVRATLVKRFKATDFGAYKDSKKANQLYKAWENQVLKTTKVPRNLKGRVQLTPFEKKLEHLKNIRKVIKKIEKDKTLDAVSKARLKQRLERLTRNSEKNKTIVKYIDRLFTKSSKMSKTPKAKKLAERVRKGDFDSREGSKDVKQMKKDTKEVEKEQEDEQDEFDTYTDIYNKLLEAFRQGSDRRELVQRLKQSRERLPKSLHERHRRELKKKIDRAKSYHRAKGGAKKKLTPEQQKQWDELKEKYGIDLGQGLKNLYDQERKRKKRKEEERPKLKPSKTKPKVTKKKGRKKKLKSPSE